MTRSLLVFFTIAVMTTAAFSQDVETLFSGELDNGGFGGPVIKGGPINGDLGIFVGGRGGWIINHSFILGGGGYGLTNAVKAKVPNSFGEDRIDFGYGGLELEYIRHYDRLIHWSAMLLIGAGSVGYRADADRLPGMVTDRHMDEVFVLEPALLATLNVATHFRVSAGASYRYVTGATTPAATNSSLTGATAVLTLRFGKF